MKNKRWIISLIVAIVVIAVVITFDLVSKHFAEKLLIEEGVSGEFIPGFINFVFVKNTGGGWSIFAGHIAFLVIFSLIVALVFTAFYAVRLKKNKSSASITLGFAYGLIFGGFFGNFFDRVAYGAVRDFINFEFMSFPVFNIADIALCIGSILLIIYFIFIFEKEGKRGREEK